MSEEPKKANAEIFDNQLPSAIGVAQQIAKAEIDTQIATAKQYPRSMKLFMDRAKEMVSIDEETAQSCIYRRPVGKDRDGNQTFAEGKSVRFAEIVGASYGNLRVSAQIVEQTERKVIVRGIAHDLESNFAASSEVVESTVTKDGRPYSEGQRAVVAKAALAKARRDATFMVVPSALCKPLEDLARKTAIGDATTLEKRRRLMLDWINKIAIEPSRVWKTLGINGIEDVGLKEIELLTGIYTAIKDGDTTPEEAFPADTSSSSSQSSQKKGTEGLKDRVIPKNQTAQQPPVQHGQPQQTQQMTDGKLL